MGSKLRLLVGLKTDPILYRYSFEWLCRLLADEGVGHIQLGTSFELYQLPDNAILSLRRTADRYGLAITSTFTSHRELGGFFVGDPAWEEVARRNFARLIQIGALVGARSVGSNPGAVLRDRPDLKEDGIQCYLANMKELMCHAHRFGVEGLTIEPMSSASEPPTLPEEMERMLGVLLAYRQEHPESTASVGLCADISHGYVDGDGRVVYDHMELLRTALPYIHELHLRNTDPAYISSFGFGEEDRRRGVVDVRAVREMLVANRDRLPMDELIGYLEIPGPKLGRDHTDGQLEGQLRDSLRYLNETFAWERDVQEQRDDNTRIAVEVLTERSVSSQAEFGFQSVLIAPSVMCADQCRFEEEVRSLEAAGCDWLHFDVMDAHFVPNMPLGLEVIRQSRKLTELPFDVQLMVEDSEFFIQRLADIGVDSISVHAESALHLDRALELIRSVGARAGIALNPATPLPVLDYVLERLDYLLIMTVNPGYAGQSLVPATIRKIADARAYLDERGLDIPIEVDGNVSFEHIPEMVAAGAQILVCGTSSIFRPTGSVFENVRGVRAAIEAGIARRTPKRLEERR